MSKADSPARRPITPPLLVILGVVLYFMGLLFTLAPQTVPMMAAFMATMLGPLACLLLLAAWYVSQPVVAAAFRKRPQHQPAAEEAVVAGVADEHAGSTAVQAPGAVTSAAPAPFTLDPDAPPRAVLRDGPSPWRTAGVRLAVVLGVGLACAGAWLLAHENSRFFFTVWGLPLAVGLATVALWLLFHAPRAVRVAAAAALFLAAVAPWEVVRMKGVWGDFSPHAQWRWTPKPTDAVAAYDRDDTRSVKDLGDAPVVADEGDWVGFRGPRRDGRAPRQAGTKLVKLWERPVGPGWGSVSGAGELLFTQEQRPEGDAVVCYDLEVGKTRWTHAEGEGHSDPQGGPGPRATPTLHQGKVYALGGDGVLVCLDARAGKRQWKADLTDALDLKKAHFGFACSPLVYKGKVYVHPGVEGPVLAAFDAQTGKKAWVAGHQKNESYSSPQLATLAGVEQVLVFGSSGLSGFDPQTGDPLWHYAWGSDATAQPSVQPTLLGGDRVVIGGAQPGTGFRCVQVTKKGDEWNAEEVWKTQAVSPRFNDVVLRDGYLYGVDSGRLFCLDASDGSVVWKSRGATAGSGQVLLVGDRLLVQEERGRLAWYDATPEGPPKPVFVEALKDKTWNHPSLVRGRLLVRNSEQMMCFEVTE
jgi:outer membrane protein assembly factor BamB